MNIQTEAKDRLTGSLIDYLQHSSVGLLLLNRDFSCLESNLAARELVWARIGETCGATLPEDFQQTITHHCQKVLKTGDSCETHLILLDQQQESLILKAELSLTEDNQQNAHILITLQNASRSAQQARELKLFRNAVENTGSAVVITDKTGRIQYANNRFSEISGYSFEEIKGQRPSILRSEKTSESTYKDLWDTILNHQKWRGTLYNRRKNGSHYWALQNISPIHDELGNIINFVSVSEDISQIKEHDELMEKLAYFDPLTDLGNRRSFRRALEEQLNNPQHRGLNALLLLDLDHFKQINDTLGHEAGDSLLTTIANRLNFCTNENASVFRLGGDEFTVVLRQCDNRDEIIRQTEEILGLLSQSVQIGPHDIRVTVSIGITLIGRDSYDASDLLRNADLAMYYAKRKGRNTFAFYAEHMDEEAQRNRNIEHDLRNALDNEQLYLVYQPQIDSRSGETIAMEALLRWNHPLQGEVSPANFIPHAEETGLIVPIGRWVLETACQAAVDIQRQGLPPLKVCVNLSTRQFDDPQLILHIREVLSKTGLEPQWLELEITESMLMQDIHAAIDTLEKIKEMGISLAIDDFGTGYSSLNYLKRMPVDILKIDRSFVHEIPEDKDNMAITSTIIAMSRQLGLLVVAEGVEHDDQMTFLRDHGCHVQQGFLISRPLPINNFLQHYQSCKRMCSHCPESNSCENSTINLLN